jgi:hypothetical protein
MRKKNVRVKRPRDTGGTAYSCDTSKRRKKLICISGLDAFAITGGQSLVTDVGSDSRVRDDRRLDRDAVS